MQTSLIKVSGMTCPHCVRAVEEALHALSGVRTVEVDLAEGMVKVVFDCAVMPFGKILDTIAELGYTVQR